MSVPIVMDGGGKIAMDGSSNNGQQWCNGWLDGEVFAIGDGTAVALWMAQWVADDCPQHRSGAMGGNVRWTEVVIMMDSGGKIAMDGGSNNLHQWCQWAAGCQSNCDGQWECGSAIDGIMSGR
jgi:hypothetical protein